MAFDCPRQCFALLAVLCAVSAVGQRTGRCHGSGYMNLAWSGMSKSKCLERAFEVNKAPGPAGQCGYVSYSGSAGPQQRTDFCRCHAQSDCGDPLDQPEGEMWETLLTSDPTSPTIISSSAPRNLISLVSCAVAGMLVYPSP